MAGKPNEKPPASGERGQGVEGLRKLGALTERILAVKKTDLPPVRKRKKVR